MSDDDATELGSGDGTEPQPDSLETDSLETDSLDHVERSSLGQNLAYTSASQLATWCLGFALAVVQPRYLGPTAIGQLRLAFSLWLIAGVVVGLGTTRYLTLNVARHRGSGVEILGPIIVLRLIVFGIASVGFAVAVAVSDASSEFRWVIALVGLSTFFSTLSDAFGATFVGLERMSTPAIANVVARVVGAVLVITVLLLGGDVVSVVAVAALGNAVAALFLYRSLRKLVPLSFRGWPTQTSRIIRGSIGFMGAGAALMVYQQIDTVIIALLVDTEVLGWYATADTLFGTLLFPMTILMAPLFPVLGRLFTDDPDALADLVIRTFKSLAVVAIPLGLGTIVVAPELAPLLLGEDFRETGEVLVVLGPVLMFTFGAIMFGTVAQASGRQRFWSLVMFGATALTIPLDLVFVPWADRTYDNGAIGGAMAYVVTEALMVTVGVWKIAPYLATRETAWRIGRNLIAGGVMLAASWPLHERFIAIPIAVAVVVYVAAIFALRIVTDDERAMIGDVLAKVGIARSDDHGGDL